MKGAALRVGAFAVALVLASSSSAADLGRQLFRGTSHTEATARFGAGSTAVPARRLGCSSCHGRDARGSVEGTVAAPSIEGQALARPTGKRPAYSPESFARALADGVDPAGRGLSPAMPRYAFTPAEAAALFGYLERLWHEDARGVASDVVRFALVVPPGRRALGETIRAAFARAWQELGDPRPHGRRPELEVAELDPGSESGRTALTGLDALALLLAIPDRNRRLLTLAAEEGVPVVLPFAQAEGNESPEDLRTAFPTMRDEISATLTMAGGEATIIADERNRARLRSLGLDRGRTLMTPADLAGARSKPATLVLMTDGPVTAELASADLSGVTVFRALTQVLREPAGAWTASGAKVKAWVPYDPKRWSAQDLTAARLAATAAGAVHDALIGAGRDVSRSRFMRAFGRVSLAMQTWPALDYARHPLGGTNTVGFVPAP